VPNLIEPWGDVVTSEEEAVAGPDSMAARAMTFEGHHASVADTVVIRSRTEATHVGEFHGIAPTGRRIGWGSVRLAWIKDARVIGQWPSRTGGTSTVSSPSRVEPGHDLTAGSPQQARIRIPHLAPGRTR